MRDIARDAHKRGLNRQMTPAQFKLLDPKGTHILSPQMYHDKADGKPVEGHIRVYAHIKLIGKHKAVEKQLDVSSKFLVAYITGEEATSCGSTAWPSAASRQSRASLVMTRARRETHDRQGRTGRVRTLHGRDL